MLQPVEGDKRDAAVRRLDALAHLLDDSIPVPGTGMRFGLDAVIGLIPAAGDAVGGVLSSYIVLEAARLGVGLPVLGRMLLNLVIDLVVGAVPFLGDLFDAGWKANHRNLDLVHRALQAPGATRRSSAGVLAGVLLLLAIIFGVGIYLAWMLIHLVFSSGTWRM
jgi:hypothetical protein